MSKAEDKVKIKEFEKKLKEIVHVLDELLGDTDPDIADGMDDESIKQEYPLFWATRELFALLNT